MSKEWVELGPTGLAIRIFRHKKSAVRYSVNNPAATVREMLRKLAVEQIRRQVFTRDEYACVKCGKLLVWERGLSFSAELDEVQARGTCLQGEDNEYSSGEISVANGQTLCGKCHTGGGGKHDRAPSFTKTSRSILNHCESSECKGTLSETFCEFSNCKGIR